jgi:hypothetical protein
MKVGGQRHTPATSPPGLTQYPLYRRLGRPCSGRVRKISPPLGFDPRTAQPVASRYTDWAIPAHIKTNNITYMSTRVTWSSWCAFYVTASKFSFRES